MRVLLVEDERDMAALIARNLTANGFVVDRLATLADAKEAARTVAYSLLLLDRRLPDGDGARAIAEFRRIQKGIPVIVLTALDSVSARVEGLDLGADDYLIKPFALDELLARIRAALRRPGGETPPAIRCGRLSYDSAGRVAMVAGEPVTLTRRELALLEALVQRAGRVVAREALMERIYGFDDDVQDNAFDALVSRLRRRCAELDAGVAIHTVRGLGYVLRAETA